MSKTKKEKNITKKENFEYRKVDNHIKRGKRNESIRFRQSKRFN